MKNDTLILVLILAALWWATTQGGIGPSPGPAPIPSDKFRVMIVEETAEHNKTAATLDGWKWREYIKGKGGEFRVFDDDIADADLAKTPDIWKRLYAKAKEDAKGVTPWLTATDGVRSGVSGPLPATEEALLESLQKIGGK